MAPLFFDHLVIKTEILEIINHKDEPENQKGKALQLIDDILYQGVIDHILTRLDQKHHRTFLTQVSDRPYDPEVLSYLKENIGPDIEEEIKAAANKIVRQILKDLSE